MEAWYQNKTLAFTGDTTHHQILLTETPRTEFVYDTDPKQAVASRLKVLDMLASQKMPLHAYHFPWPGYGYVARQGDGYRYYPVPMEIVRIPPKQT
jgi:glyoxylase-like metal-dependent hydrolase (beta-lactamase superfamily II)